MSREILLVIDDKDLHRYEEAEFRVSVQGWSKPRPVYRKDLSLIMDIAVADCMCTTCVQRFEIVLFSMRDRGVKYEAGSWNKSCAVRFTNVEGISDEEICDYLTKQIGIPVSNLKKLTTGS